jgi:hypothetical protein
MRRIFLSLALIIVAGGTIAFGATKAFFSDVETSTANVFTAGAIDLKIDNESYYNGLFNEGTSWSEKDLDKGDKFFDFGDLKPSDYGEDTISIHIDNNDSYMCADVTLTSNKENNQTEPETLVDTTIGEEEGELANLVNFIWWADDGDNVLEDDENVISGPDAIGKLPLNETYPITLADSETNIWNENTTGGPVAGGKTYYIGKAWCFGTMGTKPLTQDDSSENRAPNLDNNADEEAGTPEDGGVTCDGSLLGNESQTDSLTADIAFSAVQARHNKDFKCEKPELVFEECTLPTQKFATAVVSSSQGVRKDGTPVIAGRTNPTFALGAPQSIGTPFDSPVVPNSFFSLGFNSNVNATSGGSIVVEFGSGYIVDGPGNDIRAWEVTGGSSYPTEKIKIEVSQDGSEWVLVTSSADRDAEADLASSGLTWAKYVRITDVSSRALFEDTADGYDLDAVSALNCGVLAN